jgi:hypothetical protein
MYYLRSTIILTATALLTSSADARHPYRHGRPGYVTGPDGHYQAVPTGTGYAASDIPQPYGNPPYNSSSPTGIVPYSPTGTAPAVANSRPKYLYGTTGGSKTFFTVALVTMAAALEVGGLFSIGVFESGYCCNCNKCVDLLSRCNIGVNGLDG